MIARNGDNIRTSWWQAFLSLLARDVVWINEAWLVRRMLLSVEGTLTILLLALYVIGEATQGGHLV